jgi:ubiquinone/menaquinone biosynthesis C-methylase UbiE
MSGIDSRDYLATGFRDVDDNADLRKFLRCLEFMNELESFQQYKRSISQRLELGQSQSVVDIGCGLGYDVIEAAHVVGPQGSAIGIDKSEALISAARNAVPPDMPQVAFEVGNGEDLRFDDGSVDAIRVDRTLQHVQDPRRVVTEMYRVLKASGRAACAEPDWGTLTITSPDRAATRQVVNAWCDSFRQGWIGRQLKPMMESAGFRSVVVTGHLLIAEGYAAVDRVFDVVSTVARLSQQSDAAPALQQWLNALQENEAQGAPAIGTVTLFLATGRK